MKICADSKIPFLKGVFEPYAEIEYLPPSGITPEAVRECDALIVRTRTKCGESLLNGSKVKFIATATIGFDHIDPLYCGKNAISWTNAPGCNAGSVAQYLTEVLLEQMERTGVSPEGKTLGIVGCGHVGKCVEKAARALGMNLLVNDPPRERVEGKDGFVSLSTVAEQSDYITFHVPLIEEGPDATRHLADGNFFRLCRGKPFFINASRGETVDSAALAEALERGTLSGGALDVWEHEPDIDSALLAKLDYATPHIAGYSIDGKANGTAQAVRSVARFFGIRDLCDFQCGNLPEDAEKEIFLGNFSEREVFQAVAYAVRRSYSVLRDDARLRSAPGQFEQLRSDYPFRREFGAYTVSGATEKARNILLKLGFQTKSNEKQQGAECSKK